QRGGAALVAAAPGGGRGRHLQDAQPGRRPLEGGTGGRRVHGSRRAGRRLPRRRLPAAFRRDRKSTRLNSSHVKISYAVFCLKKKNPGHDNKYNRKPLRR